MAQEGGDLALVEVQAEPAQGWLWVAGEVLFQAPHGHPRNQARRGPLHQHCGRGQTQLWEPLGDPQTWEASIAALWCWAPTVLGSLGVGVLQGVWSIQRSGTYGNLGFWRAWGTKTGQRLLKLLGSYPLGPAGQGVGQDTWVAEAQTSSSSERENPTVRGYRTGLGGAELSYPSSLSPKVCRFLASCLGSGHPGQPCPPVPDHLSPGATKPHPLT